MSDFIFSAVERKRSVQLHKEMSMDSDRYNRGVDEVRKLLTPESVESISEFLMRGNHVVPPYQRDYSWTVDKEVIKLLSSVESDMNRGSVACSLGGVIINPQSVSDASFIRKISNILTDGQQRDTTIILILAVGRDIIHAMNKKTDEYKNHELERNIVSVINNLFKKVVHRNDGEKSVEYILTSSTRPEFNIFLQDIFENTGVTYNVKAFKEKYVDFKDGNIKNALKVVEFVHNFFIGSCSKQKVEGCIEILEFTECFVDYLLNNVYISVRSIRDSKYAKELYYKENMTGMPMSFVEGVRFMAIAENTKVDEVDKYGELWSQWIDKYREFTGSKIESTMGLLTLVRANFKGRFSNLAGGSHNAKESTIYDNAISTIIKGDTNLDIKPNEYCIMHILEDYDKYLDIIRDLNSPRLSKKYKAAITFLKHTPTNNRWLSALLVPFDFFGMDALKIIEGFAEELVRAIGYMLVCHESTNTSLIDDMLDGIICKLYREQVPYATAEDLLSKMHTFVTMEMKKNGNFVNKTICKTAFESRCNNNGVKLSIPLLYAYISDYNTFYDSFKGKETKSLIAVPLLKKSGENLENGEYAIMNISRWCCTVVNRSSFRRNSVYHNSEKVSAFEMDKIIRMETRSMAPSLYGLFHDTIGCGNNRWSKDKLIKYKDNMFNTFMNYLGI